MEEIEATRTATWWSKASIGAAVISIGVFIVTIYLAKHSMSNGLYGPSVAPVVVGFAGYGVMCAINFLGIVFSLFELRKGSGTLAGIGLMLNAAIPFAIYVWFTNSLN